MNTAVYTKELKEANQIVVDIETIADLSDLPDVKIDSRIKDLEKVQQAMDEARFKQIEKAALSPRTGQIACIGYFTIEKSFVSFGEEEKLIEDFIKLTSGKQVITFNGKSFDIPFLFKRGIKLGVKGATIPAMKSYQDRYRTDKHIDIMSEYCGYGEYTSLNDLSRFLLGSEKMEFNHKEIPELLKTEEGRKKIEAYCLSDCSLTYQLAKKMGF